MADSSGETIAAIATAPGRGGVAVVRVSGPEALRVGSALTGRTLDASCAGRFFYARFSSGGVVLDDGLVLVFAGPRSYTGEDVVELQGHGGSVAPRRVLEACLAAGARLARRGEFTQRAFLNGRLDLGAAEAVIDLVDARTERAADDAVARLGGGASRALEALYAAAIDVSSQVEHALDFSEDELPESFADDVDRSVDGLLNGVERKLSTAREGRLLRDGALVVLAGAPNAGKSSLLNALLGTARAIVSATAGTTRDSIEEWMEIDGWPVRLVDTAGLRVAEGAIEAEGVARAEALIAEADLVLRLEPVDAVDENGPSARSDRLRCDDRPSAQYDDSREIRICSKCDLLDSRAALLWSADLQVRGTADHSPLRVSARTGEGLDELRKILAARLAVLAAKNAEETGADVTTRQKDCLLAARAALVRAREALALDWVVAANELREAAMALGRVLGKVYSDDLLDALFSRFCVGK